VSAMLGPTGRKFLFCSEDRPRQGRPRKNLERTVTLGEPQKQSDEAMGENAGAVLLALKVLLTIVLFTAIDIALGVWVFPRDYFLVTIVLAIAACLATGYVIVRDDCPLDESIKSLILITLSIFALGWAFFVPLGVLMRINGT